MSHNKDEIIICPNCGYEAKYNYCEQCGQSTHLHKETFWGLVVHFAAHYFHYDSKFFQTIKTLILKPGALTLAYWNNQRARFIPPISLYIFVSSLYFICAFFFMHANFQKIEQGTVKHQSDGIITKSAINISTTKTDTAANSTTTTIKAGDIPNINEHKFELVEKTYHHAPKVYFFMVPFLAVVLLLLFKSRKELLFVDHAVFSLHIHTLWFILFLAESVVSGLLGWSWTVWIFYIPSIIYIIAAVQNTYNVSTAKAIGLSVAAIMMYLVVFVIILGVIFIYYMREFMLEQL